MGTKISGIMSNESLDTHAEKVLLDGMDISTLDVDGKLIFEHKKDIPSQIVGRVIFAKKIFKEEDCETSDQLKWWKLQETPFLYGIGELFEGHEGAEALLAILKHDMQNNNPNLRKLLSFSIDGQVLSKKEINGVMTVTDSVARDCAITLRPANKMAQASLYQEESSPISPLDAIKTLFKNESNEGSILSSLEEKVLHLESLLKTDDLSEHAKNMIREGLANMKGKQESINGKPRANLQNEGKPMKPDDLPRVPKSVPVPRRKEAFPNPYGPTSKKNIGQPKVISGEEFKAKIQAFKENAKKQNEELRDSYADKRPEAPKQKIPSMGSQTKIPPAQEQGQPKLSVIPGGKQEQPKTNFIKEVFASKPQIKKSESAGGIPSALGSRTGFQALQKEADCIYSNWDKKGKFEDLLSKKMPKLTEKEIKALSKAYAFKDSKDKEKALESI